MVSLAALLGKKLKEEEILQLLEDYQVGNVVYSFDRLREGASDEYWAEAKSAGFALRFDQNQALDTVFCYVSPIDGFAPVDLEGVGMPAFATVQAAKDAAEAQGIAQSAGHANVAVLGLKTSWVRHEHPAVWAHYEFRDGRLAMISLSRPRP
jgi:hypothetical protein